MEFKFTGIFYVEEEDIEEMKEKIKKGEKSDEVFQDWAYGLDDADYYIVDNVRDQIMKVIMED